jgi:hypothetical protein
MSRRSAPRREVVAVRRDGPWGHVVYRHSLACGHTESRKRIAPSKVIGCTQCVQGYEVGDEVSYEFLRLKLAERLRVPQDAVEFTLDQSSGPLRLRGATIRLTPELVKRLSRT